MGADSSGATGEIQFGGNYAAALFSSTLTELAQE